MTKKELLTTIKVEVERRRSYSTIMSNKAINSNMRNFYDGAVDICNLLTAFLDTLENKIHNDHDRQNPRRD